MKRIVAGLVLAVGMTGCAGSSGSPAGTPHSSPPEKKTDVNINTPGANIDIHGRKPEGTGRGGKTDVDVDVKKKDH
jgi:hypothetical protein